ncbi:MAG: hypothetical protein LBR35_01405 [Rickettsiales bacterium]|jgi:hypothetical protein|nr:hypothetical protein [Rickettsiales bacterium]
MSKRNKFLLFGFFLFALFVSPLQAHAALLPLILKLVGGLTALSTVSTATLELAGGNIFNFLYDVYSDCYTCKYVSRMIDFTVIGSNRLYEVLSPYIMIAIPLVLIFYAVYLVLSGFFNRDNSNLNAASFYSIFGPKVFAMFFAFALLAMPTPKLLFQYIVNPALSLATNIGIKLTMLGGGEDADKYYIACMAEKQPWEDEHFASADNENHFKDVQKQMTCITKQAESINATGIVIGNVLMSYASHFDYNWLFAIPNLGMLFSGLILTLVYSFAIYVFAFYLLEVFLYFYIFFIFMPFSIASYVLSQGKNPIPRIKSIYDTSINKVVQAMFTLVFLCLLLSIVQLIAQSAWFSTNTFSDIIRALRDNDVKFIIDNVYFGSKSFMYLLIAPLISIILLSQAKTLAGYFKIPEGDVFSDKLLEKVNETGKKVIKKTNGVYKEYKPQIKKTYDWTKGKATNLYNRIRRRTP